NPRSVTQLESERVFGKAIEHEYCLADLLRRPDVSYADLMSLNEGVFAIPELTADPAVPGQSEHDRFAAVVLEQIEIAAKYSGYIDRQKDEVARAAHYEGLRLPAELDYMQVSALSIEARQKLNRHRPETLGQASRISGITPASISLLLIHLKKKSLRNVAAGDGPASGGGVPG
ncbi:MAG: tRNA uridine-5-carboxymethylaminomethyl(34) synthesis enzyme MnmG, partial [Rhodoferax sp.]